MNPKHPANSRVLVQLQDPMKNNTIIRPDEEAIIDPVGTVIAAASTVTACAVGDAVLFTNNPQSPHRVVPAPKAMGPRMFFVHESDILCILQAE